MNSPSWTSHLDPFGFDMLWFSLLYQELITWKEGLCRMQMHQLTNSVGLSAGSSLLIIANGSQMKWSPEMLVTHLSLCHLAAGPYLSYYNSEHFPIFPNILSVNKGTWEQINANHMISSPVFVSRTCGITGIPEKVDHYSSFFKYFSFAHVFISFHLGVPKP